MLLGNFIYQFTHFLLMAGLLFDEYERNRRLALTVDQAWLERVKGQQSPVGNLRNFFTQTLLHSKQNLSIFIYFKSSSSKSEQNLCFCF